MPQTFAITGATGLIGRHLATLLRKQGHTVHALARSSADAADSWNPGTGRFQTASPIDTLIHLAGKNVATRWTTRAKKEIWDSRVAATEKLARFLATLPADKRPRLLLSASAIGIYGNRADEVLTEDSAPAEPGRLFLADLCRAWEAAARPAEEAGIRVIYPRIGVVLARESGALAKLRTPTRLGLAGPVGKGTQWIPWISLTDLTRLLAQLAADHGDLRGPINAVGPAPVRQHEFIRTLGRVLHRPTIFPLPAFAVQLVFGQMGTEALLTSLRVISSRIPQDFQFEHSTLEAAIRAELALPVTA
jgi:uncharacterized protein (TIGR01777 family)